VVLVRFSMSPGWQGRIDAAAKPKLEKIADQVLRRARANMSGHVITGELLRSLHRRGTSVFVGTSKWIFIEYGTSAHIIMPRRRGHAMKFDGRYARKVHHPGNPEYAPMRDAINSVALSDNFGFASFSE